MAIAATPTNFYVQNSDTSAFCSWDIISGATTYTLQRSTDGVTFTTLASPALNNYNDASVSAQVAITSGLVVGFRYQITSLGTSSAADWTAVGVPSGVSPAVGVTFTALTSGAGSGTATVQGYGNQYYYQVASTNGSGTSAYTTAQSIIQTPIGLMSLGQIRLNAQQRADRVNSNFVTLPEWNTYITLSYKELYDLLIQKFGDDYFIAYPYTYTTNGTIDPNYQAQVFPLPPDFYKAMRVEVALNPSDPNSWITLKKFEAIQANLYNYPNQYTMYGITNLRYRIWGSNLQIVPITTSGQTLRLWYSPKPPKLVQDSQIIDMVSGWEEYIIVDAAIKALRKEESDTSELMSEKMMLTKRIEEAAENRDVGLPERVSDSQRMNFAWGAGDDLGMSGGGY